MAPERVLLLTFTRRAADDMLGRAAALAGLRQMARRCAAAPFTPWRTRWWRLGRDARVGAGFSVLDPADAADVMDMLRDEHGLSGRRGPLRGRRPSSTSTPAASTRQRPLGEVVAADFPWCEPHLEAMAELFRAYVTRKRVTRQLDFDDLLLYWRAAAQRRPARGRSWPAMFDHVLVDEYQDVNSLQVDIVKRLRPAGRASRSSATTPRRSTASAAPTPATCTS